MQKALINDAHNEYSGIKFSHARSVPDLAGRPPGAERHRCSHETLRRCLECRKGLPRATFPFCRRHLVAWRPANRMSAVVWSAGRKVSMASSARLMSSAVPKTVVAPRKDNRPASVCSTKGTAMAGPFTSVPTQHPGGVNFAIVELRRPGFGRQSAVTGKGRRGGIKAIDPVPLAPGSAGLRPTAQDSRCGRAATTGPSDRPVTSGRKQCRVRCLIFTHHGTRRDIPYRAFAKGGTGVVQDKGQGIGHRTVPLVECRPDRCRACIRRFGAQVFPGLRQIRFRSLVRL